MAQITITDPAFALLQTAYRGRYSIGQELGRGGMVGEDSTFFALADEAGRLRKEWMRRRSYGHILPSQPQRWCKHSMRAQT